MDKCIFCQIIENKLESKKVYEDDNVLVILDVYSKVKGHSLIIPKIHNDNLIQENFDLIFYIKETISILKKEYDVEDFKVLSNIGQKAGQEIFHTHVHIIPHY